MPTSALHAGCRAVVVPAAAWAGASLGVGPPRWVALLGVAVAGVLAVRTGRRLLLAVAVASLVGSLATDARRGLDGVEPRQVDAVVTLAGDPEPVGGAWRAVVRLGGTRLELWARGGAGGGLRSALTGEELHVVGRVRPLAGLGPIPLSRHLAGRLDAEAVTPGRGAPTALRVANSGRRALERGAASLPADQRALLLGVLVGDDRGLSPLAADAARASGLSHLTAVSGQNVALLLGVATPLLRRLELSGRLAVTLALLGAFVLVTRAEPSVLRAACTAGAAALGVATGRPLGGARGLAVAVTALLVVDPLLVHSLGFSLSVAATLGILVLAGPVADRLTGPAPLRTAVAVTTSAQLAVAPLLLATGLDVPAVALPANLAAAPLAGAAMLWGLVAAPLAALLGDPAATVVHRPTGLLLGALLHVAEAGARLGLGSLGWAHLAGVAAGGLVWLRAASPWPARCAAVVAVGALVAAGWGGGAAEPGRYPLGNGAEAVVAPGATVVVLDGRADAATVLSASRRLRVGAPDLVVVRSPGARAAGVAAALAERHRGRPVVAAPQATGGAVVVTGPVSWQVGGLVVQARPEGDHLVVEVVGDPAGAPRSATTASPSPSPSRSLSSSRRAWHPVGALAGTAAPAGRRCGAARRGGLR